MPSFHPKKHSATWPTSRATHRAPMHHALRPEVIEFVFDDRETALHGAFCIRTATVVRGGSLAPQRAPAPTCTSCVNA